MATSTNGKRATHNTRREQGREVPAIGLAHAIALGGLSNSDEVARFMAAIPAEVMSGSLKPEVANTAINAVGKQLKAVAMAIKFGVLDPKTGRKVLTLHGGL